MRYASRLHHYLAVKNEIFSSTDRDFLQKRYDLYSGTARPNSFFRIDLFRDNHGTVRAFKINQSKR